jgi:hypothetical protein
MVDSSARINICIRDGTFEISGSEKFVEDQLKSFRKLITEYLRKSDAYFKYFDRNASNEPGGRQTDAAPLFKKTGVDAVHSETEIPRDPDDLKIEEIENILKTV